MQANAYLNDIIEGFDIKDAQRCLIYLASVCVFQSCQIHRLVVRVKDIEKTTNHDVKAVEYLLKEKVNIVNKTPYVLSYI